MTRRPNFLWISTDQQRADTIHSLGNSWISTPNIDAIVERGVAFERAYCQAPICTPSRASFMTGMYPGSIRACMNGNDRWAGAAPLVSRLLADEGYHCGLVGKLHLSGFHGREEPRPEDDGFSVYERSNGAFVPPEHGNQYALWLESQGVSHAELTRDRSLIPPELHQNQWIAERSAAFIRNAPEQRPWFLFASYVDPHPIYEPPRVCKERVLRRGVPGAISSPHDDRERRRLSGIDYEHDPAELKDVRTAKAGYYGMIELVDETIGTIMDTLQTEGQLENTVVIFSSDHGDMMGDHGLIRKGCRFYDGLVRIPLVVMMPRPLASADAPMGQTSRALVELTDVTPTLLDLAAGSVPDSMHGRSLAPLLRGTTSLDVHRPFVRSQYYRAQMRPGYRGSYGTMIRDERYKLVLYHGTGLGQLFDLADDPTESRDRFDDPSLSETRLRLTEQALDAEALTTDLGPTRTRTA